MLCLFRIFFRIFFGVRILRCHRAQLSFTLTCPEDHLLAPLMQIGLPPPPTVYYDFFSNEKEKKCWLLKVKEKFVFSRLRIAPVKQALECLTLDLVHKCRACKIGGCNGRRLKAISLTWWQIPHRQATGGLSRSGWHFLGLAHDFRAQEGHIRRYSRPTPATCTHQTEHFNKNVKKATKGIWRLCILYTYYDDYESLSLLLLF